MPALIGYFAVLSVLRLFISTRWVFMFVIVSTICKLGSMYLHAPMLFPG